MSMQQNTRLGKILNMNSKKKYIIPQRLIKDLPSKDEATCSDILSIDKHYSLAYSTQKHRHIPPVTQKENLPVFVSK
jgi:hypothetical protein